MAAPAYASSGVVTAVSATTIVIPKPSGTVAGSLLVTAITVYDADNTVTLLSGWTFRHKASLTGAENVYIHVYERIADGAEGANFTWTKSATNYSEGLCVRVSGNDTSAPYDTGSTNNGTSTTPTALGVTTAVVDELLIIFTAGFNQALSAHYSGFATDVTYDVVDYAHSKAQAAAGATGNFTATKTSEGWATVMVAYKPPVGAAAGLTVDQSALAALFTRHNRQLPVWGGSPGAEALGTNAPAEHAAATGTADSATVQIAPTAGHASATGAASDAAASIKPSAGHAAGVGAATSATVTIAPTAGHAAATGTAHTATAATFVAPVAGHAAATGAAFSATVKVAPTSGHAAATGTASTATAKVAPTAGSASGSGAAHNATVATGTFAAAGHAAATGAAHSATPAVAPTAGVASATGAASPATVKISPTAGVATGTGAASPATAKVAPTAGHAAGTGAAHDATVITGSFTFANAGNAAGTGVASAATVKVAPRAGAATGTGAAFDATVSTATFTNAPAGHAAGTGQASNASSRLLVAATLAAGSGLAHPATATIKPSAGHATATGAAWNATALTVNGGAVIGGHGTAQVVWRDAATGTITALTGNGTVSERDDTLTLVGAASGSAVTVSRGTGTGATSQP